MELKRRGRAFQPLLSSYGEFNPKEKRPADNWGAVQPQVLCCKHLGDASHSKRRFQQIPGTDHPSLLQTPPQPSLSGKELNMGRRAHAFFSRTALVFGRSFFPLFAIAIIVGATVWGPWVSLGVTVIAIVAALRLL
jgi:hypothetical protein